MDSVELSMGQMRDFRDDTPGAEAVMLVLNYHGLFLLDSDRPYDNQALSALKKCRAAMKAQYDAVLTNITKARAAAGTPPNEEALEETLSQMGYVTIRNKVDELGGMIKKLEGVVVGEDSYLAREQLDPTRTVFVLNPPKQFPSVAMMELFLDKNPEVAAKHTAHNAQVEGASSAPADVVSPAEQFLKELE
jgi:hypothetical protein